MNDGLEAVIEKALSDYDTDPDWPAADEARFIAAAVRAFLALPPSEEEIAAALDVLRADWVAMDSRDAALVGRALVASRAVLVPPPEDAR